MTSRDQMFAFAAVFCGQLQAAIRNAEPDDLPVLADQMRLMPQLLTPLRGCRYVLTTEPAASGESKED